MGNVSKQDLEALVEIFDKSDWEELHIELPGLTIELSKRSISVGSALRVAEKVPALAQQPPSEIAGSATPDTREPKVPEGWTVVRAPNLGTFYRAPKPGESPYVEIGQEVQRDTQVCLIEVMKLFTSVNAGAHGIVREICVSDGDMVEYNQALVVIEPVK